MPSIWEISAKERKAFGKMLIEMQNRRFKLAEVKTVAQVARVQKIYGGANEIMKQVIARSL